MHREPAVDLAACVSPRARSRPLAAATADKLARPVAPPPTTPAHPHRGAGLSAAKAQTVLRVARLVADGLLPLDAWRRDTPAERIRAHLLALRGIGPWTVDYTLLRGFALVDGSLHGDVAVRRGLQRLLEREEKIGADEAKHWLADFAPWRALAAAHLWAAESPTAPPPDAA